MLTVQSGLYRFFTRAQLDGERIRYIGEVQKANTRLIGAAINGQSYTFSVAGREMSLAEWGDALADAYNQLGDTQYGTPAPRTSGARF
jgi:hypothetical protein